MNLVSTAQHSILETEPKNALPSIGETEEFMNLDDPTTLEQQKIDLKNIRADMWKVDLAIDFQSDKVHLLHDYKEMSIIRYELEMLYWNRLMLKNGITPPPESNQVSEMKRQLKTLLDKAEHYTNKLDQTQTQLKQTQESINTESQPLVFVKEQTQIILSIEKQIKKEQSELVAVLERYRALSKELLKKQVTHWNSITDTKLESLKTEKSSKRNSFRNSFIGGLISSANNRLAPPKVKIFGSMDKSDNWIKRVSSTLGRGTKKSKVESHTSLNNSRSRINRESYLSNENTSDCSTLPNSPKSRDVGLLMQCAELKNSLTSAGVTEQTLSLYNELVQNRNRQLELEKLLLNALEPEPLTEIEQKFKSRWIFSCKEQFNECVEELNFNFNRAKSTMDIKELEITNEALQEISKLMPVLDFKSVFADQSLKVTAHRTQKLLQELVNVKSDLKIATTELSEVKTICENQSNVIAAATKEIPNFLGLYNPDSKLIPVSNLEPSIDVKCGPTSESHICVEPFVSNWPGYISILQGDVLNLLMVFFINYRPLQTLAAMEQIYQVEKRGFSLPIA